VRDHRDAYQYQTNYSSDSRSNYKWDPYTRSWKRPSMERSVLLGSDMFFEDHEYRKDIIVGAGQPGFDKLRIDATGGQTYLMKVVIEFADGGSVQVIDLNQTLRGYQTMTLDLSGQNRKLNRILIYRSEQLINKAHHGEFTVTAL
jgi:hypothetical protein